MHSFENLIETQVLQQKKQREHNNRQGFSVHNMQQLRGTNIYKGFSKLPTNLGFTVTDPGRGSREWSQKPQRPPA
jgi:hypothetical protein